MVAGKVKDVVGDQLAAEPDRPVNSVVAGRIQALPQPARYTIRADRDDSPGSEATMVKRRPTPAQQEYLDAVQRCRQLRRQHIRRTQVINGRVYLGRYSYGALSLAVLTAPVVVAFGLLGWGVRMDAGSVEGAGLLLIGLFLLLGLGQAVKHSPASSPTSPVRLVTAGAVVLFFSAITVLNRDAAQLVGILGGAVASVMIIRGILGLAHAAVRLIFRRRPRPEDLDPISHQDRPAA